MGRFCRFGFTAPHIKRRRPGSELTFHHVASWQEPLSSPPPKGPRLSRRLFSLQISLLVTVLRIPPPTSPFSLAQKIHPVAVQRHCVTGSSPARPPTLPTAPDFDSTDPGAPLISARSVRGGACRAGILLTNILIV